MATATTRRQPTPTLACHDAVYLFPETDSGDRERLKADIADRGVRVPVVVWRDPDGKPWIIDGRTRVEIAGELGTDYPTVEFVGTEPEMLRHLMSLNFLRRHLSSGQRAAIVAKAELLAAQYRNPGGRRGNPNLRKGGHREDNANIRGQASGEVAEVAGSNRTYIDQANRLKKEAPQLLDEVAAGKKTMPQAIRELNGTADDDEDVLRDQLGRRVPDHLRGAAEQTLAIEEAAREINGARAGLKRLPEGPLSDRIKEVVPEVDRKIRDAVATLRAVMLHAVCGLCDGAGCETCGHAGFHSREQFEQLPRDVRARLTDRGRRPR